VIGGFVRIKDKVKHYWLKTRIKGVAYLKVQVTEFLILVGADEFDNDYWKFYFSLYI